MSNSVRPHRRQPTRLPRPWNSPGKNTGVGCHFLLQCMKVKSEREVAQSCPTLSDPMDCSLTGSSVHGIFQARVLEWGAIARLPCSYTGEITTACWGQGACSLLSCGSNIIWTDGYKVIVQMYRRYQLKGNIGGRDLSLTIENTVPSDSGLYCCRIEKRGCFNDIKIIQELSIRPGEFVFLLFFHIL